MSGDCDCDERTSDVRRVVMLGEEVRKERKK
jgi:hypothetical protein